MKCPVKLGLANNCSNTWVYLYVSMLHRSHRKCDLHLHARMWGACAAREQTRRKRLDLNMSTCFKAAASQVEEAVIEMQACSALPFRKVGFWVLLERQP